MKCVSLAVYSDLMNFKLELKHNINILTGLSSSNKTHLVRKILEIENNGNAGKIISDLPVEIIDNRLWETLKLLDRRTNSKIYIVDEDFRNINSQEFKDFIYRSNSYFIIISRENNIFDAPIDIRVVYKLAPNNGEKEEVVAIEAFSNIIDSHYKGYKLYTEDSKSGKGLCEMAGFKVERSLGGVGNVKKLIRNAKEPVSLFVDLVAFAVFAPYVKKYKTEIRINLLDCKSTEHILLHNKIFGIQPEELEPGIIDWDFTKYKSLERLYIKLLERYSKEFLGTKYKKGDDLADYIDSDVTRKMHEIFNRKTSSAKLIDNF